MEIIKIGKAAELLGVCTVTLRNWEKKKKLIPFLLESGHRRYNHDDGRGLIIGTADTSVPYWHIPTIKKIWAISDWY